ncbi:hypothetical protein [Janibacter sp. DB-40]|uniref:hypothetical protein n=1 Tax=Janibacter sp. DB-40 TaxID=3028808 RepID=UPI002404C468|nr:hypothetical protein [Janibacter sp. DB-40]
MSHIAVTKGLIGECFMADEIELVGDGDGVAIVGNPSAVERFLDHAGLREQAQRFDLGRLRTATQAGGDTLTTVAKIVEKSGMYLKLTPESAQQLRDAGGLMKTKTKGVSHAMLGETGKKSLKWLQVEDGPSSLLSNPAVLSGVGGLMSQLAQQVEAHELKELLVRIDEKLDDVRRVQRDAVLARMTSAGAAIDEAMTIHAQGGDPKTVWDKVSGVSTTIFNVQDQALLDLRALADNMDGKTKTGELKRAARGIDGEVAVQLAILARCFELQDSFRVVELDYVLSTAPENLEGHRLGVAAAREMRRAAVLGSTSRLMSRLDAAGAIANDNILLHARAARSVIGWLNATAEIVEDFHAPLGIGSARRPLSAIRWREAVRDPQQRRTAGKEAGQKALVAGGAVAALAFTGQALTPTDDSQSTS